MRTRLLGLVVSAALLAGCRTETSSPHGAPGPQPSPPRFDGAGLYAGGDEDLLISLDQQLHDWGEAHSRFDVPETERLASGLRRQVNQHLDFLLHVLASHDLEGKLIAAGVLGFSGDRGVVPALLNAAHDENDSVRANALYSIGLLGSRETPMNALVEALHDPSGDVRGAAAAAIEGTVSVGQDRGSYAALVEALNDEDPKVVNESVRALGVIGRADVVPTLVSKTLHNNDYLVRLNTATVLAIFKVPTSIEPLIDALMDADPRVQKMAAFALEKITGESFGNDLPRWRQWWRDSKEKYFPPADQPQPLPTPPAGK